MVEDSSPGAGAAERESTHLQAKNLDPEEIFKPPLSVIVIQQPPPPPTSTNSTPQRWSTSSRTRQSSQTTGGGGTFFSHSSLASPLSASFSSSPAGGGPASSSPFRLQPRNPPKCIPSPSRSMSSYRGRKRRAHSISTYPTFDHNHKNTATKITSTCCGADSITTETTVRESLLGTPLREHDPDHGEEAPSPRPVMCGINFQGLSLQSPPSCHLDEDDDDPNSSRLTTNMESTATSPASLFGSQASLARSCFSKYQQQQGGVQSPPRLVFGAGAAPATNAAEDVSSFLHHPPKQGPTNHSTNNSSWMSPSSVRSTTTAGSPRIAPLTVLGGGHARHFMAAGATAGSSSVATQLETAAAIAGCSPILSNSSHHKKRPPLHHYHHHHHQAGSSTSNMAPFNFMQSLDESAGIINGPAALSAPAPTTPPRFRLPSTVLCHPSTPGSKLSHEATSRNQRLSASSRGAAAAAASSDTAAAAMTTPKKQSRTEIQDSPGKRSVMSMSPTSTPLPRLTLTPRSTTSSHARQLFLHLSTADATANASPTTSAEVPTPSMVMLPSPRRNTYIPLPDWADERPHERIDSTTASSNNVLSTSLLAPPSPNDAIERFLKDSSVGMNSLPNHSPSECMMGVNVDDDDSLSASDDDDETFFLATPSVIQEEKQTSLQQQNHKQRRLRDSFSSSLMQASSTSLRGMNFVASSTSLDKIGGGDNKKSSSYQLSSNLNSHGFPLKRQDSQVSIGLTLEGAMSAPSGEENLNVADMGIANGGGGRSSSQTSSKAVMTSARDLVTPPVMPQPKSPPPLASPRISLSSDIMPLLPPRSNIHYTGGSPLATGAAASSPHSHWPCAGEVESPMNIYGTARVLFTSTAPDGSPSD